VQVLDHQDEGALAGDQVEEPPPGREGLVPVGRRLTRGRQPHQRGQPRLQPLALRGVDGDAADRRVEPGGTLQRVVGLQDAGLGLDDLAQAQKPTASP
jgi:hypothetical protein